MKTWDDYKEHLKHTKTPDIALECYFTEQITKELITEGLSVDELINEFYNRHGKISSALESILGYAHNAAIDKVSYYTYDDVFDEKL